MNPALVKQIRWAAGEVYRDGDRWRISDDADRVLLDVLLFALEAVDDDVERLVAALTPGGEEFASGDGMHGITWLEEPEDGPWGESWLTREDLAEHELWEVAIDGFGRPRPPVVVTGAALRELVRQLARCRRETHRPSPPSPSSS